MKDYTLKFADTLKFEILESIKGWIIMTGESILEIFKKYDKQE